MFNSLLPHPCFVPGCRTLSEKIYVKHADYTFMSSKIKWGPLLSSPFTYLSWNTSLSQTLQYLWQTFITTMSPSLPSSISCSKSNCLLHTNLKKSSDMTSSIPMQRYLTFTYTQFLTFWGTVWCLLLSRVNSPTCCSESHLSPFHVRPCSINYSLTLSSSISSVHQKKFSSTKTKILSLHSIYSSYLLLPPLH